VIRQDMLGMFGGIQRDVLPAVFQPPFIDKALQPARPVDFALHAIIRVMRQQPLHVGVAKLPQGRGIGDDDIACFRLGDTRWLRVSHAVDFDEADAAHRVGRQSGIVAQRGNVDAGTPGSVEQCRAFVHGCGPAIYREFDHLALLMVIRLS
jgi:hypothetical protein